MTLSSSIYKNTTNTQERLPAFHRQINDALLVISMLIVVGTLVFSTLATTALISWHAIAVSGSIFRFLPELAIFLAAILSALTLSARRLIHNLIVTLRANWFLTGFIFMALPGALYARFIVDQETSYFTQVFTMLVFWGAYFVFLAIPERYWLQLRLWVVRTFGWLVLIASIVVLVPRLMPNSAMAEILTNSDGSSRPDTVLLLTQGLALCFYLKSGFYRIALFAFLTVLTVLTFKNTAVLILLTVCICFYVFPKQHLRKISFSNTFGLAVVVIAVLFLIGGVYFLLQSEYSDGHTIFRSQLYEYQYQQFLTSPLYGHFFTEDTAIKVQGTLVPVHSDWMDVLGQGGLVGLTLFIGIFARTGRSLIRVRSKTIRVDIVTARLSSWLLMFLVVVTISFSFNPILGIPEIALILWVAIAFAQRLTQPYERSGSQTTISANAS